jgi:outer membrane protein TolC
VEVAELYNRLRYVVTARTTLQDQRKLLGAAVEIATTRYAIASAPQSDPLEARVAVARLDTEDADLAAEEATLRARLSAIRHVADAEQLPAAPIRPEAIPLGGHLSVVSIDGLDSLSWHPRIAARAAALASAGWTARAEELGGRPGFSITTRYGARPLGSDFLSAFVGVRLPLWAGRKQHRLADAARADADAAQAALTDERATLRAELRGDLAGVTSGETRLRLLVAQVIPPPKRRLTPSFAAIVWGRPRFSASWRRKIRSIARASMRREWLRNT